MFYLRLYINRKGMNVSLSDDAFLGPTIGPFSGVEFSRGDIFLSWFYGGASRVALSFTEEKDHVRYGGTLYDSFIIFTEREIDAWGLLFDEVHREVHTPTEFTILNGI